MTPSPSTKTLTVVRHSKAMPEAASDHARPLAPRGLRDARAAGEWLAARPMPPVLGLVSTAVRARQTWETIAAALDATETRALDGLYAAGVDEVVETLHMLDESDANIIVVGHNPTMQQLVWHLSDHQTAAHAAMSERGFPTSAISTLEHPGPWQVLTPGTCAMTAFHVPRA